MPGQEAEPSQLAVASFRSPFLKKLTDSFGLFGDAHEAIRGVNT